MKVGVILWLTSAVFLIASCSKTEPTASTQIDLSAKVVFMVGDVKVENNGKMSSAAMDMTIGKGSTVVTSKRSECNLLIGSDSYIMIKENSKLLVESLIKDAGGAEKNSVDLQVGKLVVNPKKLLKNDEFTVKTQTAIAAVRGTKFVVSNAAGENVKISVVEGKVEMKPRVESIEDSASSPVIEEIKKKIDDHAVIIEANQSASIQTAAAEKLNKEIQTVIKALPQDTGNKTAQEKADIKKTDLVAVETAVTKIQKVEIAKVQIVEKKVKEDVADLDKIIENDKIKRAAEAKPSAMLNIVAPVKDAEISINGKRSGRGTVNVKVDADVPLKIDIVARGFDAYTEEITLAKDESKTIEAALVRSKLRDRLDWSAKVGNIKGDLLFYNDTVISVTSPGSITAMKRDGAQLWKISLGTGIDATPALSESRMYLVGKNENLYAIEASSGSISWSAKTGGTLAFGAAPRVAEGNVIVALSNGKVRAFSKDGKDIWTADIGAGIYSTPAFDSGMIYVGADDQMIHAIAIKNGDQKWKGKLDGRVVSSSPVIFQNKVIVGTFKGSVIALSTAKGKQDWAFKTGGSILSAPVIKDGKLYIGSKDQKVYALDPSSGKELWSYKTNAAVTAEISYNDASIFVLAGKTVYAFNRSDGALAWTYALPEAGSSIIADSRDVYVGTAGGLAGLRIDLRDVVKK
jgi:outer membrane protein assembly factor BamB